MTTKLPEWAREAGVSHIRLLSDEVGSYYPVFCSGEVYDEPCAETEYCEPVWEDVSPVPDVEPTNALLAAMQRARRAAALYGIPYAE